MGSAGPYPTVSTPSQKDGFFTPKHIAFGQSDPNGTVSSVMGNTILQKAGFKGFYTYTINITGSGATTDFQGIQFMLVSANNTLSVVDTGELLNIVSGSGNAVGILGSEYAVLRGGESRTLTLRGVFDRTGDSTEQFPGAFAGKGVVLMIDRDWETAQ